jgi:hypothetical protein
MPIIVPSAITRPQAWASGAPLLLLRAMLGLEPVGDRPLVDSALPTEIGWLQLLDIPALETHRHLR